MLDLIILQVQFLFERLDLSMAILNFPSILIFQSVPFSIIIAAVGVVVHLWSLGARLAIRTQIVPVDIGHLNINNNQKPLTV